MAAEARAEVERLEQLLTALDEQAKPLLIPQDPLNERSCIMEIRAGTGGDEAALFAGDLLRMYTRYIERKGWKIETEMTLKTSREPMLSEMGQPVGV